MSQYNLFASVTVLWGISKIQAGKLKRLNIETIEDFLFHFPSRYLDYRNVTPIAQLQMGEASVVRGSIFEVSNRRTKRGMKMRILRQM